MNENISSFPGAVVAVLILAFVLAIPVGLFIISLYKKALVRGMSYSSVQMGPQTFNSTKRTSNVHRRIDLNICELTSLKLPISPSYSRINSRLRYHWIHYGLKCLVFAAFNAFCWLIGMGEWSFYRFLYATLLFSPVILPVSYLLLVRGRRQFIYITTIFFIIYLIAFYVLKKITLSEEISYSSFITPFFFFNLPAIILIGFLRLRSIKPVGIFIYSFFLVCSAGPMLMIYVLSIRPDILEFVGYLFIDAGFSAKGAMFLWVFLSFAAMFLLGLILMSKVKKFYVNKNINDMQLNADTMFVIFNIIYSLFISFGSITYALISLLAFPFCKLFGYLLLVFFTGKSPEGKAPRLLILRVFALGDDSRNLFERLLRHWRYGGSVQLISGPDLATSTVEPHELLAFVSGSLKKSFCNSEEDIIRKTGQIDDKPDLDKTYRVNEFFCRDNNWKVVLAKLINNTEVILMDLRSFSSRFQGCRYEIETLVDIWNLDKAIFIVDHRTDIKYLHSTFEQAFQQMAPNSPNSSRNQITIYKTSANYHQHVGKILQVLCCKINTT